MKFLSKNCINTTTQLSVPANTSLADRIYGQDIRQQYITDGFGDDATSGAITITFDVTTAISQIALLEHNLKSFCLYYNGNSANTFSLSNQDTTVSNFVSNSETSMFLNCQTAQCTSITLNMKSTIEANAEKAIGRMIATDLIFDLDEYIPAAQNYTPKYNMVSVEHRMSDGGKRVQYVNQKYEADVKLEFIPTSLRNSLKNLYDLRDSFIFVAFPTMTAWDGVIFDCVWSGSFEFFKYADNAGNAGFTGKIQLDETTL